MLPLARILHLWLVCGACLQAPQAASPPASPPPLTDARLLEEVERRAFRFFWEQADPNTGLVNDRARNRAPTEYTVASIASTGYALAALPIAVERHWIDRPAAAHRARLTLQFVLDRMPQVHGWLYHFVDKRTGERVWRCELSSIDTTLLCVGALTCGQYFGGEAQRLANALYDRMDWTWMRTNAGANPDKRLVSMGWTPEKGFISADWDGYTEGTMLYLLGMGARRGALPAACWTAWKRSVFRYGTLESLAGGPIFLHEMAFCYYPFRDRRDRLGYDYWISAATGTRINRQFCIDRADRRRPYGPNVWGLNASDGPSGYMAYGVPEPEDGTVSPTGALASILFAPEPAKAAAHAMYAEYGKEIWGRYGFADAFNVDADWYDPDVIGIDLGMVLLAVEDHRSGLVWRLLGSHPSTARALAAAGLRRTMEKEPRPLRFRPSGVQNVYGIRNLRLPLSHPPPPAPP